jgi:hypothetical protein
MDAALGELTSGEIHIGDGEIIATGAKGSGSTASE